MSLLGSASSFLSNQNKSPVQSITSAISSQVTSTFNNALAQAGASVSGIIGQATQTLDGLLSGSEASFFSGSPERASIDQLSSLRNVGGANNFINTIAPQGVINASQASTSGSSSGALNFPSDLSPKYFFQLNFAKYVRPAPMVETTFNTELTINLPLPAELAEGYSMNYSDQNQGPLGILYNVLSAQRAQGSSNLQDVARSIKDNSGLNPAGLSGSDAYAAAVAGAGTLLDENAAGALGQFTGVIPNPHPSVLFQGINLRTHTFSWTFVPKNADESTTIKNIINQFRTKTLPAFDSTATTSLLDYPYMLQPYIFTGEADSLYRFKRCVCDNFVVQYAPLGSPAFYGQDNSPFAIQMNISLKEIEYFTATDFTGQGGGNGGQSLSDLTSFLSKSNSNPQG